MEISKHILVIDDEPNIRRSLTLILQGAGYLVSSAATAAEALTCLSTGYFDLILLDIQLPDRNGMDLLPIIRRDQPDLPVVLLTAHATLHTAMDAVRHGARDYLVKPIRPALLLERVHELLQEQNHPRRRQELVDQIQNLITELQENEVPSQNEAAPVHQGDPRRQLRCGNLTLSLLNRQAFINEKAIRLPPTTFDYLVTLVRHSPNPVTYENLVMESQGYNLTRSEAREMAGWHIHELRKLIETTPRQPARIITVRNIGYRCVP